MVVWHGIEPQTIATFSSFLKKQLSASFPASVPKETNEKPYKVEISKQVKNLVNMFDIPQKAQDAFTENAGKILHFIPHKKTGEVSQGLEGSGLEKPAIFFISGLKIAGLSDFGGNERFGRWTRRLTTFHLETNQSDVRPNKAAR